MKRRRSGALPHPCRAWGTVAALAVTAVLAVACSSPRPGRRWRAWAGTTAAARPGSAPSPSRTGT